MKSTEFARVGRQLLAKLPGFVVRGPMIFIYPFTYTLRGLYLEGSSFDTRSFYVWTFFLPLVPPQEQVSLNFGKRLRTPVGGDRWNADAPNLIVDLWEAVKRDALPFLAGIEKVEDIPKSVMAFQMPGNPYAQEAIAYAWARSGEWTLATQEFDRLLCSLDLTIPWQREIAERTQAFNSTLLASPSRASCQLDDWEADSRKTLRL